MRLILDLFLCRFVADLSASLAFLHDHRVNGRSLLPATAFFEAAAAAGKMLKSDDVESQLVVGDTALMAPLILMNGDRSRRSGVVVIFHIANCLFET